MQIGSEFFGGFVCGTIARRDVTTRFLGILRLSSALSFSKPLTVDENAHCT